jgi:hypothetical protein
VRVEPLVGKKVWFGPHRIGWGLEPVSWEGWLVTAAAVAGAVRARTRSERNLIGGGLLAVAVLKGTSPGGPRAWKRFRRAQSRARRRGR